MPPIQIRNARPDDAPSLATLLGELGYPTELDLVRERVEQLASRAEAVTRVAVVSGRVVGMSTLVFRPTLHEIGDVARLTAVVVDTAQRGQGIGRQLVADAERIAWSRGAGRMEITSAEYRHEAHSFYEHLGYRHNGRRYTKDRH